MSHDVVSHGAGRLFGREAVLTEVSQLLARATAGGGGGLVVHGEPGTGRTSILDRAAAGADAAGGVVLRSIGVEDEQHVPLSGVHRLLDPVRKEAAEAAPTAWAHLARAFGSDPATPDVPGQAGFDLLEVLRGLAALRPVLCCVDDVRRLDRSSRDALAFVARRCERDRLVIILADDTRPAGTTTLHDGIPAHRLTDLSDADARALLQARGVVGEPAAALIELASGHPGALVDLCRAVTADDTRAGVVVPPVTLPADSPSRQALLRLLDPLGAGARTVVLLVAADDRLTEDELLRSVATTGLDDAQLRTVQQAGLVEIGPDGVRLRPAVLGTVAYHAAAAADRRAAHAVLARALPPHSARGLLHGALALTAPDARVATELAERSEADDVGHVWAAQALERAAELAEDPATAQEYRLRAARRHWLEGRPHRARHLLEVVGSQAPGPRLRAAALLLSSEIDLSCGLEDQAFERLLATTRDLDHDDGDLTLSGLFALGAAAQRLGHEELLPEVARRAESMRVDAGPLQRVAIEQITGLVAVYDENFEEGVAALRRVLTLAETTECTATLLHASLAGLVIGDDLTARRFAERAATLARGRGEVTAVHRATSMAAHAEFALGRYAEASALTAEALNLARATGQDGLLAEHVATLSVLAAIRGRRDTALEHLAEVQALLRGRQSPSGAAMLIASWALSVVDLIDGAPAAALHRLNRLAGQDAPAGHQIVKTAFFCHFAEAAAKAGEPQLLRGELVRFEAWAGRTTGPGWQALAERSRALLSEDEDEAEAAYLEAQRLHLLGCSELERARTDLLYGQWLRRRRRPRAARAVLQSAWETFEQLEAPGWAAQAAAELRASGERAAVVSWSPEAADLTAQQRRIAMLAAAGASNQEIAGQLYLSVRTVEYHLGRVFTRLGLRSRTELAALNL